MNAYLDAHPELVEELTGKIKILEMNDYSQNIYNKDLERGSTKTLDSISFPESLDFFKGQFLAIANGDSHFEAENSELKVDGSLRNVFVSIAFPQEAEQFHNVLVSLMDISALKQTEAALRASEDRYHKMMQMANDAIFVTDMESLQLVDVNDKAQSLMDMDRETLLSMQIFDLYPDEVKEKRNAFYEKAVDESFHSAESCQIVAANGKRIEVEITNTRIELDNKTLLMGIFRDVTERRKQERVREALLSVSIELRKIEEL